MDLRSKIVLRNIVRKHNSYILNYGKGKPVVGKLIFFYTYKLKVNNRTLTQFHAREETVMWRLMLFNLFFQGLEQIAKKYDISLMIDEIQTGKNHLKTDFLTKLN